MVPGGPIAVFAPMTDRLRCSPLGQPLLAARRSRAPGETITLHHTAHTRDTLVRGALRAAEWLLAKPPALYSMTDVLGIK